MDFQTFKERVSNVTNVIMYSELTSKVSNFLHPVSKSCIILVLYTETVGHYVAIFGTGRTINYFDSYSSKWYFGKPGELKPELPLPPYVLQLTQQDHPLLFESITSDPKYDDLKYNTYTIQKASNTCGGWCLLRILFKELNNRKFYDMFKDRDDLAYTLSSVVDPAFK